MEKELRWEKQWIPEHLSAVGNEPWDTVWDRLTDGFRPETVPAGTVFYQQGDPAREVIFLQTGQIRVECIHSSGKKRVLCLLLREFPWERTSACSGGPREYRAVAVTACQIFRIPARCSNGGPRPLPPGTEAVPDLRPEEPGAWPHADP